MIARHKAAHEDRRGDGILRRYAAYDAVEAFRARVADAAGFEIKIAAQIHANDAHIGEGQGLPLGKNRRRPLRHDEPRTAGRPFRKPPESAGVDEKCALLVDAEHFSGKGN